MILTAWFSIKKRYLAISDECDKFIISSIYAEHDFNLSFNYWKNKL